MEYSENRTPHAEFYQLAEMLESLRRYLNQIIVGQPRMIEQLLVGLLADGHILLEGVPGVAKTLAAKLLARLIDTQFSRIQFTPDLMPSDVLGTSIFNQQNGKFEFKKGPVFSNIVLIDEINRAPAKTQAALFEVMEERQVTLDGTTYAMSNPFMVIATQNPIEHEGTYRLPEAQLDRFLMKVVVGYPTLEEEVQILENQNKKLITEQLSSMKPIIGVKDLAALRDYVKKIHIEKSLLMYIAKIVHESRENKNIYLGCSPRASLALMQVSKAYATLNGRDFVIPEDIKAAVAPVIRHRIMLQPEKEMEGVTPDSAIKEMLEKIEIPK